MENDVLKKLLSYTETIKEPENLFSGRRIPDGFVLPDNILVFFHHFTASAPNSHGRCTFVFPLDRMIYYIDRKRYFLTPGDVLYVPPHAVRFLHPDSDGYRRLFITFDSPGRQFYLPEEGSAELTPEGRSALLSFLDVYRSGRPEVCSMSLVHFLSCLRVVASAEDASGKKLPAPLEKTVEYIESHLSSKLGIKELSEVVHLSESHLRMLFRTEMKIPLGHYLAGKRLDFAQYRLIHSDMTLQEIAAGCGFANVFVFGAFFKKNTGISPMKYRKMNIASAKRKDCCG